MTDKQIIIDDQKKTIHRLQDECTEKTNAIIALGEQLKLAEQRIVELNKTIKAKEQECEELKIYIESNEQQVKEVEKLVMDNDRLINELDQLKQTLTEIKEICNNNDELKGDFNLVDCDKYKLGKHNLANKILQKISECEGNDE